MRLVHLKIANEYAKNRVKVKDIKPRGYLRNEDWKEIAKNVYKEDVKPLSWIQCRKSMNMPEVKQLAELKIMDLLDKKGLTADKSLDLIKESIEMAKETKNAKLLFEQAKYLNEQHGLQRAKTVITESRSYKNEDLGSISGTIDRAIEEKRKITVSTTLNSDDKLVDNSNE